MSKNYTTFTFEVTHDDECGMWVGVCDALGVATEAPSDEALTERVWLIAPEMAQENGHNVARDCLRLRFEHVELADQLAAVTVDSRIMANEILKQAGIGQKL